MSTVAKKHYTVEEYLELERASLEKYQYYRGEVFAMSGASPLHNRIVVNLIRHLGNALADGPCVVFPADQRIKCPTALYTYADASIVCGEAEFIKQQGLDTLINPKVIFEVLSPSTEQFDRGNKFEDYQSLESFQEYVLVAQDRPHVAHFVREQDGSWRLRMFNGIESTLQLATVDCQLSFRAIFDRVAFPPQTGVAVEP
jgi:Uma2 family endonuclease